MASFLGRAAANVRQQKESEIKLSLGSPRNPGKLVFFFYFDSRADLRTENLPANTRLDTEFSWRKGNIEIAKERDKGQRRTG